MQYPQHRAVDYRGGRAVHYHRSCDDEHFCAYTCYKALGFELNRRRADGVRKARNRHERACACVLGDFVVHAEQCEQYSQKYQRDGGKRPRVLLLNAQKRNNLHYPLTKRAKCSAEHKRPRAVLQGFGFGRVALHNFIILFSANHNISAFYINNLPLLFAKIFDLC